MLYYYKIRQLQFILPQILLSNNIFDGAAYGVLPHATLYLLNIPNTRIHKGVALLCPVLNIHSCLETCRVLKLRNICLYSKAAECTVFWFVPLL